MSRINHCYKLHTRCIVNGIVTMLFALFFMIVSIIILNVDKLFNDIELALNIAMTREVSEVVLIFSAIICFLWVLFSCLLIIGVLKSDANPVGFSFGYGVFISIVLFLVGLLFLLNQNFILSAMFLICFGIHLYCIGDIYTAYELLGRGKVFGDDGYIRILENTDA